MLIHAALMASTCLIAGTDDLQSRPKVQFEAAVSVSSIAAGTPFDVVCRFVVPPKWHIYWKDPGSGGLATQVHVQPPPGFKVGQVRFPAPVTMLDSTGPVNALDGRVHLAVAMTPPATLVVGSEIVLGVEAEWLVCKEACFLGRGEATLRIPVTAKPGSATAAATWIQSLPRPIEKRPHTTAELRPGPVLRISGPCDPAGSPIFLHESRPGVHVGDAVIHTETKGFVMDIPLGYDSGESMGKPPRITGLVRFGVGRGDPAWEVNFPFSLEPQAK